MSRTVAHRAIEAVWRIESARLIGGLVRLVGDLGVAEDLAQDALLDALARWPESGVPENPGAWLMAAARFRAIDLLRRNRRLARKQEELARTLAVELALAGSQPDALAGEAIEDDVLRLMFACCHPLLRTQARVALTLRLLGGLTTTEIARAFLVSEASVAQRIVRAKRTLTKARADFSIPERDELKPRLDSVLEVIYLVFNEGYAASAGDEWTRPQLCEEALRLGRILAELVPGEGEVHGLVALMELQASRLGARRGSAGEPILLAEQARSRWDPLLIGRGLAALGRVERLGALGGPYALQAQIAACHARAASFAQTDWPQITLHYEALMAAAPSPVIALNHAVAAGMAFGAEVGLALVERLRDERLLDGYHLLSAARGDLLARLGRTEEARIEFALAASLAQNERERSLLAARAEAEV